jgi:hypothetical protein
LVDIPPNIFVGGASHNSTIDEEDEGGTKADLQIR